MPHGENVSRADNQQERLIGWITGFVDGEGCFSMGLVKQPNRKESSRERKGYKTGYQVFHEFAVAQGESSLSSLEALVNFFGVGSIYLNKRYDNHKEYLYRYVVRKRTDLKNTIIPFFQQNKLRTSKKDDFEYFVKCFQIIDTNKHLTVEGIKELLDITKQMNRRKDRSEDILRILNDHTRNSDVNL